MEILDEIRTEQDRVVFLKSVAEQLLVKARVKLNLKNLYQANGFAVRELLKVATLLHNAYKDATAKALGKNHDVGSMQKQINRMVEDASVQVEQMERMLSNVGSDEQNLQLKIDKKKTELDRHEKRLQSLQTVRPAHMDEYEDLE